MKARDVMTPNPTAVTPADTIAHAAALMRDLDVGIMPVVDDLATGRLEGVITDRDIAVRCVAAGHGVGCRISDHMTSSHLHVVRDDASVAEAIKKMETDQVRRIPVVADGGRLVGIIAQADIAMKLGPHDASLVEELVERISEPARARR
jgi:CBS domain-containing protein